MIDRSPDGGRPAGSAAFRRVLCLVLVAVAGACGLLPSEPPKFEETYVVQAASLNLSAVDLAPAEVGVNADSSAFEIISDSTIFQATLGQMCSACGALNGTTAPKPAFTATFSSTIPVSSALIAASVAGGTIDIGVGNGLNFDPVRPNAVNRGTIVVTVRRSTTTIATYTINGTTTAFAPGSIIAASVPVSAFNLNGPLAVDITVTSPAGDPVLIDVTDFIIAQVGPVRASISQVTVSVASQTFADTVPLDLTESKIELGDKVEGGAFRFTFTNPFAVGGSFSLKVLNANTNATILDKAITLAQSATSANRLALTKAEIASLLGKPLKVVISGSFAAPSGQLTLTPKQVANFTTLLELVVRPLGD